MSSNLFMKKRSTAGFLTRIGYYVAKAFSNIRQNLFLNVITVGTIILALLVVSLFALVFTNLEHAADSWTEKVQIAIYYDRDLTAGEQDQLKSKLVALPATASVTWVSKATALERFKQRMKGQEALLEGVRSDVLPASLEVTLKKAYRTTDGVERYARHIQTFPGIGDVQYGEEWVRRFNGFLDVMRIVGLLLLGFLVTAVIFIVSNTIKLTVMNRQDELEIMLLVGATPSFIKLPFLIEGFLQGLFAGIIAQLTLWGLFEAFMAYAGDYLVFNPRAASLIYLPIEYIGSIIFGGALLGLLGSLTATRRSIRRVRGLLL